MVVEEETALEAGLLIGDQNDSDDRRITPVVVLSTFAAVCGCFSYGCATSYTSAAQSGIMEDLGLSVAAFSTFGSLTTLGGAIGALFSGKTAGVIGRRWTMWVAQMLCIVGWLAIAFANCAWLLYLGRISIGIGIGVTSYVVPVYVAEITPKNVRGAFTFSNQLLQNCGSAFVYFTGNFWSWRSLAIIGAIPCLVQVVGLYFIPESPRWLAKKGQIKEIEHALHRLRGKDADISREAAQIRVMTEKFDRESDSKSLDLFRRRYRLPLAVGIGLMLFQQLSGSAGVLYYASRIYKKADFSVSFGTTALGLLMVPKAIMGLILVDKWGRRPLLMASVVGMCLSSILLGVSFTLQDLELLKELTPIFAFIGVLAFIATYAIGLGGLPWIIMSEIFPISIKSSAGSLVTLINWLASWIITLTFNFLLEWNPSGTFFMFSGILGGGLVFVCLLVPETKDKTLEEIQALLLDESAVDLN